MRIGSPFPSRRSRLRRLVTTKARWCLDSCRCIHRRRLVRIRLGGTLGRPYDFPSIVKSPVLTAGGPFLCFPSRGTRGPYRDSEYQATITNTEPAYLRKSTSGTRGCRETVERRALDQMPLLWLAQIRVPCRSVMKTSHRRIMIKLSNVSDIPPFRL